MTMTIGSQQTWRQIFRDQQQQFVCDTESEKERVNKHQKDAERNRYADGDKTKQKSKSKSKSKKQQQPKINLIVTERPSLLPTAAKFSALRFLLPQCKRVNKETNTKEQEPMQNDKEVETKQQTSAAKKNCCYCYGRCYNELLILLFSFFGGCCCCFLFPAATMRRALVVGSVESTEERR